MFACQHKSSPLEDSWYFDLISQLSGLFLLLVIATGVVIALLKMATASYRHPFGCSCCQCMSRLHSKYKIEYYIRFMTQRTEILLID